MTHCHGITYKLQNIRLIHSRFVRMARADKVMGVGDNGSREIICEPARRVLLMWDLIDAVHPTMTKTTT
jgi:hypothetical protein